MNIPCSYSLWMHTNCSSSFMRIFMCLLRPVKVILFLFPLQNLDMCMLLVSACIPKHCIHNKTEQHTVCRQTADRLSYSAPWSRASCTTCDITAYSDPSCEVFLYMHEVTVSVYVDREREGKKRTTDMTECLYNSELMGTFVNSWHQEQPRSLSLMLLMRNLQPVSCQHWRFNEKIMKQEDRDL